jgi:recombination protein RecA
MISAQQYEKDMDGKTYGGISAVLTLFSKRIIPICARTKCLLIGINQVRDDMNSQYGGTTTTGGKAWRHNCTIRLEFSQSDFIDEKGDTVTRGCENPAGHCVKVLIVKSKVCPRDRKIGFFTLKYLTGIDYISDTIDVAVKENIIQKAGAWYTIVDTESGELATDEEGKVLKFQGKAKLHDFLEEVEAWYEEIYDAVSRTFS